MDKILFASNNKGKWLELVDDFKEKNIDLVFSENEHLNLEEDELTMGSNALSKARSAAKQMNMMTLGDDSGICIDELDFWPGVHSRRWYGAPEDDKGRCEKILEMMKGETNRLCYLISRFTLVNSDGEKLFSTSVRNAFRLSEEYKGENGFGYDHILQPTFDSFGRYLTVSDKIGTERLKFILDNKLTIAQLSQEEKNAINNRGRIALEIRQFLDSKKV